MSLVHSIRLVLAAPHRAGRPFIAAGLALALAGVLVSAWVVAAGGLLALACWGFFRDPERVPPPRPGVLLAAADGRVVSVERAVPPAELGLGPEPCWRVATSCRCWTCM